MARMAQPWPFVAKKSRGTAHKTIPQLGHAQDVVNQHIEQTQYNNIFYKTTRMKIKPRSQRSRIALFNPTSLISYANL